MRVKRTIVAQYLVQPQAGATGLTEPQFSASTPLELLWEDVCCSEIGRRGRDRLVLNRARRMQLPPLWRGNGGGGRRGKRTVAVAKGNFHIDEEVPEGVWILVTEGADQVLYAVAVEVGEGHHILAMNVSQSRYRFERAVA